MVILRLVFAMYKGNIGQTIYGSIRQDPVSLKQHMGVVRKNQAYDADLEKMREALCLDRASRTIVPGHAPTYRTFIEDVASVVGSTPRELKEYFTENPVTGAFARSLVSNQAAGTYADKMFTMVLLLMGAITVAGCLSSPNIVIPGSVQVQDTNDNPNNSVQSANHSEYTNLPIPLGGEPTIISTPSEAVAATNTPIKATKLSDNGFDSEIYNQIINHPELVNDVNYDGIKSFGLYYIGDDSKIITNQNDFKNQKSISLAVVLEVQNGVDLKKYPKYVAIHNGLIGTEEYQELLRVYIRDSGVEITPSKYETKLSIKSEGLKTYTYISSAFLKDVMDSGWSGSLAVNGGTCRPDSAGKEVCKFNWDY